MPGYSRQEVQKLLALSPGRLRGFLAAGLIPADRGTGRALRFSFQDLVMLRAATELRAARVPAHRLKRALRALQDQLPSGAALSKVHISAIGDELVVRDEKSLYAPDSGQLLFDFRVGDISAKVQPLARRAVARAEREQALDAEGWYQLGSDLDDASPGQAQVAYQNALALDAQHVAARVNLGRLLHEAGELGAASQQYQRALEVSPEHPVAWFNCGVVLEDLERWTEAADAYQRSLAADPHHADAHHNLAHLLERMGEPAAALRHLSAYRRLIK